MVFEQIVIEKKIREAQRPKAKRSDGGSARTKYGERSDQKRSDATGGSMGMIGLGPIRKETFWEGGYSTLYYNIAPKS